MKIELTIIDPKEFGLEEKKATSIELAFKPKQIESIAFSEIYEDVITKELNAETFKEARELRLKLVKVRTGIAEIHKVEKAFFLASGKYVDALKNKLTTPIEQMEEKLLEIEQYEAKLEAERKAKLEIERKSLLTPFDVDVTFMQLDQMSDELFTKLLSDSELLFKTKAEQIRLAEVARIEAEEKVGAERIEAKRLEDERIEAQRVENERLKAEAEDSAKEQAKKDAIAKAENERLANIAKEAQDKADKANAELKAKQEAEKASQEKEKQRIEAEEAEKLAKEKLMANAGDKEKVKNFYDTFKTIEFPELSSVDGIEMAKRVNEALAMVKQLIINDSKNLL